MRVLDRITYVRVLAICVVVCLAAGYIGYTNQAFAATQTIPTTSTWRTYTAAEQSELPISDTIFPQNWFVGNPAVTSANPQNVSGSAPGWTPNGATDTRGSASTFSSVILDLPKVDLSCSSNVNIEVTSGTATLQSASAPVSLRYGWLVVNASNEPLIDSGGVPASSNLSATANVGDTVSLVGSGPINPNATAFGLKLIVSVEAWTTGGDSAQWDVYDVSARLSYDDDNGNCNQTPATNPTSCNGDYLSVRGIDVDQPTTDLIGNFIGVAPVITGGNPDDIRSSNGLSISNNDDGRIVELDFSPQNILQNAGTVELKTTFDLNFAPGSGVYMLITPQDVDLNTPTDWTQVSANFESGAQSITTYLSSSELVQARIFLVFFAPGTTSATLSNAQVNVRHLKDVAVCGINLTNTTIPTTTAPTTTQTPVAPTSTSYTLPETGSSSFTLTIFALLLIVLGSTCVLYTGSLRRRSCMSQA